MSRSKPVDSVRDPRFFIGVHAKIAKGSGQDDIVQGKFLLKISDNRGYHDVTIQATDTRSMTASNSAWRVVTQNGQ